MAKGTKIKGITIELGADTSQFKQAMRHRQAAETDSWKHGTVEAETGCPSQRNRKHKDTA